MRIVRLGRRGIVALLTLPLIALTAPPGRAESPPVALTVRPVAGLSVLAAVGGGAPRAVQVDTGSVGLIVWRGAIGADAVAEGPGEREYNSSGRIFRGTYFRAAIVFQTADGSVRTARLRVLGVERQDCDPAAPACRPQTGDDALRHVGVLGVGFDRPAFTAGDGLDQSDNPFLNLDAMRGGGMPRRYVLGRSAVLLGGATGAEPAGFRLLSLPPRATGAAGAPPDWGRASACYSLIGPGDRRFGPLCAKLLVDTGLPEMILTLPRAERPAGFACDQRCPDGIRVALRAGDAMAWEFVTGTAGAPSLVRWGLNRDTTQINTGRALLAQFDYLYDADQGVIGFRRIAR